MPYDIPGPRGPTISTGPVIGTARVSESQYSIIRLWGLLDAIQRAAQREAERNSGIVIAPAPPFPGDDSQYEPVLPTGPIEIPGSGVDIVVPPRIAVPVPGDEPYDPGGLGEPGYTPIADTTLPPTQPAGPSVRTQAPPAARPPALPPQTPDPTTGRVYRGPGELPSGGWSWDVYRREAERMISDTAKRLGRRAAEEVARRGARAVIETMARRMVGPLGDIIEIFTPGSLLGPEVLGSGELPSTPTPPMPATPATPSVPTPARPAEPTTAASTAAPRPEDVASNSSSSQPAPQPVYPAPRSVPRSQMTVPKAWPILGAVLLPTIALARGRSPLPTQQMRPVISPISTPTLTPTPTPIPVPTPTPIPLPTPTPTPATPGDPLTPTATPSANPLTQVQSASAGWPRQPTRTRTRECNCDDPKNRKKRKKPRECVVRGNLAWTSGPKKGKPAGSRCINFR